MDVAKVADKPDTISLRVTMYAIYTFVLFHLQDAYSASDKTDEIPFETLENPMFIGLKQGIKSLRHRDVKPSSPLDVALPRERLTE